jgi:hypothetical protein
MRILASYVEHEHALDHRRTGSEGITMRPPGDLHRFMQQPVLNVLGMLGVAGAAKIGHAGLAAEAIVAVVTIHLSPIIGSVMVRKLALWVADATEGGRFVVFWMRTRPGGVLAT